MEIQQKAAESASLAAALFDLIPCPVWIHTAESLTFLSFNVAAQRRLSLSSEDVGMSILPFLPGWRPQDVAARLHSRDGNCTEVQLTVSPVCADGECAWLVVANDLLDPRAAAEALAAVEARYRSIFHHAVEGIFQTTGDGRYLDCNPALARIYGYGTPDELKASITDISRQLYVDPTRRDTFVRLMHEHDAVEGFESQIRRKDGTTVWISECVRAVRNPKGELLYYEGTVLDITQRKLAEAQLRHDAFHDALTGLPNRVYFMQRAEAALRDATAGTPCALLFVDFDGFKRINDSLGHRTGDHLLISAAKRLSGAVRPGDVVARLGGDEFGILLTGSDAHAAANHVGERVQHLLQRPFDLGGRRLSLSASVGIALGDGSYERPDELVRDADVAMYRAKVQGRGRLELFDSRMREDALEQLQLESDLRIATRQGQFVLHYQPIVQLTTGRPVAFEALIRWNHPRRGLVQPLTFVPNAEETGAIVDIGDWIVRAACSQLRSWQEATGAVLPLGINVSSRQLLQPSFVERLGHTLNAAGVHGEQLRLEITETVLMEDSDGIARVLTALRERGIRICLDDFGTGFSSLSSLHRFPIDVLKIDGSFIARIGSHDPGTAILQAIVNLGHTLGLETVAEGVETEAQAQELLRLGCSLGQGYFFARPLPPDRLGNILAP